MSRRRRSGSGRQPVRRGGAEATARPNGLALRWILGGAALIVVIAALGAVVLGRPSADGAGSVASSPPPTSIGSPPATVAGGTASRPAFVATAGDPAVGQVIPPVSGTSFDGGPVVINADGRPKLLLFLAHWCPHCQREVPVVQAWLDAGRLPGTVDLISVATSTDPARPNYPPADWLRREHWQPPVLVDRDDTVADRFGLSAFPYWVAVRSDGTVAARVTGELTPSQLDALASSVAR
jgi:thiol-disulfide isomerase/thioredoxin